LEPNKRKEKMAVRAKMKCFAVDHLKGGNPEDVAADIRMIPVYDDGDPENKTWSKYTPSGEVRLFVTNPDAIAQFEIGKSYYLDFTLADKPAGT
jgi:hypothetical protein